MASLHCLVCPQVLEKFAVDDIQCGQPAPLFCHVRSSCLLSGPASIVVVLLRVMEHDQSCTTSYVSIGKPEVLVIEAVDVVTMDEGAKMIAAGGEPDHSSKGVGSSMNFHKNEKRGVGCLYSLRTGHFR